MFATFGVGAVVIACVAFPVIARRSAGTPRDLVAQRLIHRSFRLFERLGGALRLFEVRDSGAERLARSPALVVANHPTLLDVVFLVARMPQADCIVKLGAWRNPFLRGVVQVAGYIANADGPGVVDACVERLRAGRSVLVFPEGTRSSSAGMQTFRRGAARIALRSGTPLTVVSIRCDPPALGKRQRWWGITAEKLVYTIEVGAPLPAAGWIGGETQDTPRAARQLTEALRRHIESRSERADG